MLHLIKFTLATITGLAMAEASAASSTRQSVAKHEYDEETGDYSIAFSDGQNLDFNVFKDFNEEMRRNLMFHGVSQKTRDSYAGTKGNAAQARSAAQQVIDSLRAGQWSAGRGEGEARPRLGELAEAIARIKGLPVEEVRASVEKVAALDGSDEEKKQGQKKLAEWRAHPKIKAAIAQLRAERRANPRPEGPRAYNRRGPFPEGRPAHNSPPRESSGPRESPGRGTSRPAPRPGPVRPFRRKAGSQPPASEGSLACNSGRISQGCAPFILEISLLARAKSLQGRNRLLASLGGL
jgi:hypothetical protein